MIQNCLTEPIAGSGLLPSYPLFIALQNCINSLSNKKSIKEIRIDINSFVQQLGYEGERFVLLSLLEGLDMAEFKEKANTSNKLQFFIECIKEYCANSNFLSYFPQILGTISRDPKPNNWIQVLLNSVKIPLFVQTSIALSLYLSDKYDYSEEGGNQLVKKLLEVRKTNKGGDLPQKIIEQILFQISRHPQLNLKLDQEYNYLLQICESTGRLPESKMLNFFKGDWQYFAFDIPIGEKTPSLPIKKVQFLRDLGPPATFQVETLKTIMSEIGTMNEEDIFQCLMLITQQKGRNDNGMDRFVTDFLYANKKNSKQEDLKKVFSINTSSIKSSGTWNVQNFITYCHQNVPNLKWQNVVCQFDQPNISFSYPEHFLNLMKIFQKTRKICTKWKMPEQIFFKKWNNPATQAQFLLEVFRCREPDVLHLQQISNRRIQKSVKDCNKLHKQIWGYLDLVQLLIEVAKQRYQEIRQLLDLSLIKYRQIIMQTFCEIKPNRGEDLLEELFCQTLKNYLFETSPSNTKFLEVLWDLNQELLLNSVSKIYREETENNGPFTIFRVYDILQEIKDSLIIFTFWHDHEVSIPLSFIATKREKLKFDHWLNDRIEMCGDEFVIAILNYIENRFLKAMREGNQNIRDQIMESAQLSVDILNRVFFTIMAKIKNEEMQPKANDLLKQVYKETCSYIPEITEGQISDEIEKQTQIFMSKIYKDDILVKDAIESMKKLKSSAKQEDQQLLASHITFLCSQLTFHYSYPEKELLITADLFTGIINANLIQKKVYQMFLHVLENHLKEDNQKYLFAIKVIKQIKQKLAHESWFCENLLQNELIMKKHPQLVQLLIKAIQPPIILPVEKQKKIKEAIKAKNTILEKVSKPIKEVPAIDIMKKEENLDYDILATLDKTKKLKMTDKDSRLNKINMFCNTISLTNLDEKIKELQKIIDNKKSIFLFAYNIVFKRITIAQNNGNEIYYRLVQKVPKIFPPIMKLTYKILQEWFKLEGKSVNDKKHNSFKNIGSWLGKMTIGQGTPIPIYKLNLKQILIRSFSTTNRVSYDIPVILKILEYINLHPNIFRTNSPWLMRLFGTLHEIQQKLKDDQTKSQIKAFFKTTQEKLQYFHIPQTSYLTNSKFMISQLDKYTKVQKQLQQHYENEGINLKILITQAIDQSIQEIVEPVIDRAVKIAKVTTKQLIMKDFALEPDPAKFQQSSYNMIKRMAGPLAQVTCRQPLKASMNRNMKNLLQKSISDQAQIENIIERTIPDNLDFGCTLIKQAVIQSAEDAIKKDIGINESIEMRKKAKQNHEQFQDQAYLRDIPAIMPEDLKPKVGGLTAQQMFIYNEFKKDKKPEEPVKHEEILQVPQIKVLLKEKQSTQKIKEFLTLNPTLKEELMMKNHQLLLEQNIDDENVNYYVNICIVLKDFIDAHECWQNFKLMANFKRKEVKKIINELVEKKYLPKDALGHISEANEANEETKSVKMFEMWLDTAHEDIEPFLRNLEQFFNIAENQIKIFFSYSLSYVIRRVQGSISQFSSSFDCSFLEAYSKLIIISYKTIASHSCSCYLEQTIQGIFQVFSQFQGSTSTENSHQRPFFKLFTNLICDVNRKEYDIEKEKIQIFYCILAKELKKINPLIYPSFSFAWAQLVSNKYFMPVLLERYEYWDLYYELFACLLRFIREYVTEENLTNKSHGYVYQYFYKGLLKLIIMIIHDYPHFLSSFSLELCILTGDKFMQLKNMITSSYPSEMKFDYPEKVEKKEKLGEQCQKGGLPKYYKLKFDKNKFNQYISTNPHDSLLKEKLKKETEENLQMFVLYFGWDNELKMSEKQTKQKLINIIAHSDKDMKEKLINCGINLLRYPNKVTRFFIEFFTDSILNKNIDEDTRSRILTNIIKRIDAEGPHPWGSLYFVHQLQLLKSRLKELNVPKSILEML